MAFLQEYLRDLVEKLAVLSQHRLEIHKVRRLSLAFAATVIAVLGGSE